MISIPVIPAAQDDGRSDAEATYHRNTHFQDEKRLVVGSSGGRWRLGALAVSSGAILQHPSADEQVPTWVYAVGRHSVKEIPGSAG